MKTLIFLLLFSATVFGQTVYKTTSGEKYHNKECRVLKSNKSTPISVRDALKSGLKACEICKPVRKPNDNASATGKSAAAKVATVQCKAMVNKKRCQHMTTSKTGYCFQHKVK